MSDNMFKQLKDFNSVQFYPKTVIEAIENGVCINILYSELDSLRSTNNLIPGAWYRITDYTCTTSQANTQATSNVFDILVRADDNSHLNENAFAAHHDGDTYFANSKLEAWELKYSLDNNTNLFAWADSVNGKGVVYYLKDEWGNECPYDFKNIKFKRSVLTSSNEAIPSGVLSNTETNPKEVAFGAVDIEGHEVTSNVVYGSSVYYYTFELIESNQDASVAQTDGNMSCCNNVIKETRLYENSYPYILGNNVFIVDSTSSSCEGNILNYGCQNNTFGSGNSGIYMGFNCSGNAIANNGSNSYFGDGCSSNILGYYCYQTYFKGSDISNILNDYCYFIELGIYCESNTFGYSSAKIILGSDCYQNTLGREVQYVNMDAGCIGITIGHDSNNISFGVGCSYITFNGGYFYYINIGNGVKYVNLTGYETNDKRIRYCRILEDVKGSDASHIVTVAFTENLTTTQYAGKNTSGNLVVWLPADNVQ